MSEGDRLSLLHVKAAHDQVKADVGNKTLSDEIKERVHGQWSTVFQDMPAELRTESSVFHYP